MEIFAVFNDGLSKSIMADDITSLAIYYRMFWTDYLIVLVMNLCQMLTIITMMLANCTLVYNCVQRLQKH